MMKPTRLRKSIPPKSDRSWLLMDEVAEEIGCSKATVHRLRRGEINGVPQLPSVEVGRRKRVVMRSALQEWRRQNVWPSFCFQPKATKIPAVDGAQEGRRAQRRPRKASSQDESRELTGEPIRGLIQTRETL